MLVVYREGCGSGRVDLQELCHSMSFALLWFVVQYKNSLLGIQYSTFSDDETYNGGLLLVCRC